MKWCMTCEVGVAPVVAANYHQGHSLVAVPSLRKMQLAEAARARGEAAAERMKADFAQVRRPDEPR